MKNQLYGTNVILYLVSFLISAWVSVMVWLTAYEAMTKLGPDAARGYVLLGLVDLVIYALIFSGGKERPPYLRTLWISSAVTICWFCLFVKLMIVSSPIAWVEVVFLLLCRGAMIVSLWMLRWIGRTGATTPPW